MQTRGPEKVCAKVVFIHSGSVSSQASRELKLSRTEVRCTKRVHKIKKKLDASQKLDVKVRPVGVIEVICTVLVHLLLKMEISSRFTNEQRCFQGVRTNLVQIPGKGVISSKALFLLDS